MIIVGTLNNAENHISKKVYRMQLSVLIKANFLKKKFDRIPGMLLITVSY